MTKCQKFEIVPNSMSGPLEDDKSAPKSTNVDMGTRNSTKSRILFYFLFLSCSCPPLFLMGDSHCLTPAWRKVELRGQARLLTPLLVTGLKCWHLRVESVFYPKVS
jgi:hypothetical protein